MTPYQSTSDLDSYFATRLFTDDWARASEANRQKAALHASRIIDSLNYQGQKADPNQEHQFPRQNEEPYGYPPAAVVIDSRLPPIIIDTVVPTDILTAHAEITLALLAGIDPDKEYEKIQTTSDGFSNVRATYDRMTIPEHIIAGIPSVTAWRLMKPYLRAAQEVKISRV